MYKRILVPLKTLRQYGLEVQARKAREGALVHCG
ncbi:MAG: hypothetical protein K0R89_3588 [Ramlibacter sp.]|jgi:hypothetical protein|nr:hypothetical protein [Ramlibacter sp.]